MTNSLTISTDTRRATVPVSMYIRAHRRTSRTVAGQAALAMLHAWNTASAVAAFKTLQSAASETLSLAGNNIATSEAA